MTTKITALNVERYKKIFSTDDHSDPHHISEIIAEIRNSQDLAGIVERIRDAETKNEKDDIKRNHLSVFRPCVSTPCHKPYETNGIIQLDVDVYDIDKSRELKQQLIQKVPSLLYAFLSPKGGLKIALLSDCVGEDEDAYREAYRLAEGHIGALLGKENCPVFDKACGSLSLSCFMSSDSDAYYHDTPQHLEISDQINDILVKKEIEKEKQQEEYLESLPGKQTFNTPENDDVLMALSYIPSDLHYDERLPINFSIFSHFGSEGVSILFSHWTTPDRKKLQADLEAQLKSHNQRQGRRSRIATLFAEAKKYGYKPTPPRNTEKGEKKGKEPTYPVEKFYTIDEADNELGRIIGEFFDTRKDTAVLFEAGAGKTTGSLIKLNEEHLKRKRNFRVAYFVNSRDIAKQRKKEMVKGDDDQTRLVDIPKIIEKLGGGVSVIRGFGKETCPVFEKGEVYNRSRCESCGVRHYDEKLCPYEEQYIGNKRSTMDYFRIYQQSHLFQPSRLDRLKPEWIPDVIVVDEDIVSNMIQMEHLKKGKCSQLINYIIEGLQENDCKNVSSVARAYREQLDSELKQLLRKKKNGELEGIDKAHYEVIRVLLEYAKKSSIPKSSVWLEDGGFLYVGWVKTIDRKWHNIPMLYLDASGSEKIISRVLKRRFKFHKIRCEYQPNVEVVQVQNIEASKGCDSNRDKMHSLVQLLEKKPANGRTGFISYMNVKSKPFISELVTDKNTCGHYGDLRGSNKFKDFNQLFVFGRHFIPTDEMIRIAKVVYRDWDFNRLSNIRSNFEPIPFSDAIKSVEKTIRMKDGKHKTLKNNQYVDWRLHELAEHLNKSETYQALHRLRLLRGKKRKQLVYVCKDVNDITVDRLIDDTAIFITDTRKAFVEAVYANNGKIKYKSNKQIAELLNIAEKQVSKMKENNKEWMHHNVFFHINDEGYCVAN